MNATAYVVRTEFRVRTIITNANDVNVRIHATDKTVQKIRSVPLTLLPIHRVAQHLFQFVGKVILIFPIRFFFCHFSGRD